MPRFVVLERRALKSAVLIEAVDEEAAQKLEGDVLDEIETDTWGDELLGVEQVDDDVDEIPQGTV